jgi:hypothetical protein
MLKLGVLPRMIQARIHTSMAVTELATGILDLNRVHVTPVFYLQVENTFCIFIYIYVCMFKTVSFRCFSFNMPALSATY